MIESLSNVNSIGSGDVGNGDHPQVQPTVIDLANVVGLELGMEQGLVHDVGVTESLPGRDPRCIQFQMGSDISQVFSHASEPTRFQMGQRCNGVREDGSAGANRVLGPSHCDPKQCPCMSVRAPPELEKG